MLKARQTLRVAGMAVILSYTRIYKRATTVVKRIFVVGDVRFNDVMRIPRGQPHATPFTRPFLAFCVRRGWLARLPIAHYFTSPLQMYSIFWVTLRPSFECQHTRVYSYLRMESLLWSSVVLPGRSLFLCGRRSTPPPRNRGFRRVPEIQSSPR